MKRYLAIFGILFIGVIAGLIVRGIPIVLQVNAGGGIPQADRNGDVNGDARLDMSDAVYLLLHIFRDGPQPVALADSPELIERVARLEEMIDSLEEQLSSDCNESSDRFVYQANDQTVIDTCNNLMWADRSFSVGIPGGRDDPNDVFDHNNFQHAGYSDWRLPSIEELSTLWDDGPLTLGNCIKMPFRVSGTVMTSLILETGRYTFFHFDCGRGDRLSEWSCPGESCGGTFGNITTTIFPVRDIAPDE